MFLPDCFLIDCFGSIRIRLVVPFEDAVQPFQKICFLAVMQRTSAWRNLCVYSGRGWSFV